MNQIISNGIKIFILIETLYFLFCSSSIIFNNNYIFQLIIEYFILIFLILILKKRANLTLNLLSTIFIFTYNLALNVQNTSLDYQQCFLTVTALDNSGKIGLIPSSTIYISIFYLILNFMISFFYYFVENGSYKKINKFIFSSMLITILIIYSFFTKAPFFSLFTTFYEYTTAGNVDKSTVNIEKLVNTQFITVNHESKYPFIKQKIYLDKIPFERTKNYVEKPNIIHFFIEGLSSRTVGCYNPNFSKLTPNIDKFSKISLLVKNYFSHTQATYRGIRGQLSSTYPSYGGSNAVGWATVSNEIPDMELLCLPHILNKNGYQTEMWAGCSQNEGLLALQCLKHFGFDGFYGLESLCPHENDSKSNLVPDRILFEKFIKRLKQNSNDIPFYIALYSTQTHSWIDSQSGDKRFDNGKSETLNTIHNLDFNFGTFLEYFLSSSFFQNTIIIFSSDHCHFPSEDYLDVVKDEEDYQPLFFDKIPLLIFDPTHKLHGQWDTGSFSSVDIVPSILHLLEFPNHPNHFMGHSLFDNDSYRGRDYVPFYGNQFLIHHKSKIRKTDWVYENHNCASLFKNAINYQRVIEKQNRLWNRKFDSMIKTKSSN